MRRITSACRSFEFPLCLLHRHAALDCLDVLACLGDGLAQCFCFPNDLLLVRHRHVLRCASGRGWRGYGVSFFGQLLVEHKPNTKLLPPLRSHRLAKSKLPWNFSSGLRKQRGDDPNHSTLRPLHGRRGLSASRIKPHSCAAVPLKAESALGGVVVSEVVSSLVEIGGGFSPTAFKTGKGKSPVGIVDLQGSPFGCVESNCCSRHRHPLRVCVCACFVSCMLILSHIVPI